MHFRSSVLLKLVEVVLLGLSGSTIICDPSLPLTVLPDATPRLHIWLDPVSTLAMLATVQPLAVVLAAIGPHVDTATVLAVLFVLSLVPTTILPGVNAVTVHVVVYPFALILAAIDPFVCASSMDLVFEPVTCVLAAIFPSV